MISVNSVVPYLVQIEEKSFIVYWDSGTQNIFANTDIADDIKKNIIYKIKSSFLPNIAGFDTKMVVSAMKIKEDLQKTKDNHVINRGNKL